MIKLGRQSRNERQIFTIQTSSKRTHANEASVLTVLIRMECCTCVRLTQRTLNECVHCCRLPATFGTSYNIELVGLYLFASNHK